MRHAGGWAVRFSIQHEDAIHEIAEREDRRPVDVIRKLVDEALAARQTRSTNAADAA
jgi:hypothetical protein